MTSDQFLFVCRTNACDLFEYIHRHFAFIFGYLVSVYCCEKGRLYLDLEMGRIIGKMS